MKKKDWFRPKGYAHFSNKIGKSFASSYVSNIASVEKHAFYPLIHQIIAVRRYKKIKTADGEIRAHSYKTEKGKFEKSIKNRKIYYATHIDSQIYSYYANVILGDLYERKLLNTELSKCITSYRRILIDENSDRCKSNIHFAKDVFDEIKSRKNCVAIAFDISEFFDSLNHKILKDAWCSLIDDTILPKDHYNIYKSLTNCSYVLLDDLLKELRIPHINEVFRKNIDSYFQSRKQFKLLVKDRNLIKKHPFKDPITKEKRGIPQGTPISAFLSNLYLLQFDKDVYEFVGIKNGFYRRYSDDIVIVCSPTDSDTIRTFVIELIKTQYKLIIQDSKTQSILFQNDNLNGKTISSEILNDGNLKPNISFQYLGFEFDGNKALIRQSSISKFYRSAKNLAYSQVRLAKKEKKNEFSNPVIHKKVFKRKLYTLYTHLGHHSKKRNYVLYAKDATDIFQEPAINKQLAKSWNKLNSYLQSKIKQKGLSKFNLSFSEKKKLSKN